MADIALMRWHIITVAINERMDVIPEFPKSNGLVDQLTFALMEDFFTAYPPDGTTCPKGDVC
ncbi:hypothetical protein [Alicyclobacillus fastidiosus]|uniref:Uncharacterized protein n=1 Tax=Alicyclobacillus fastidiosus TaxID=392011 RepID=A0ABV5AIA9_9BACL|nr:hypothetical protein [Alicyclobacillus fastidiosus]WEH10050.1 hypothetical protein PYS47_01810 [Alicyclobacillus fastidiosus]WEH10074.1 hypothetical protein PYS47_01975 [Alicyclobacillus fastidiosus]